METVVDSKSVVSETINILNQRVSVRDYDGRPIDDDTLLTLLNAARRTSTSSNTQTYSFVVVRDEDKKRKLSALAGNQQHIVDSAAFVAVCADLTRIADAAVMHGGSMTVNLEVSMVAIVDATLAGQSLALAAESLGVGIVMIGGLRNHPQETAEVLGLPDGVFAVFGLCMGWYAEKPPQKPRFAPENIIHFEQYTTGGESALADYDAELAQHYRAQGRTSPDDAWTGVVGKRFSHSQRPHLRQALEKRGFNFD